MSVRVTTPHSGSGELRPVRGRGGRGRQPGVRGVTRVSLFCHLGPRSKWVQSRSRIRPMATGAARAGARSKVEVEAATEGGTITIVAEGVSTGKRLNTTLICNNKPESKFADYAVGWVGSTD